MRPTSDARDLGPGRRPPDANRGLGRSFGSVADAYDRTRPSYPADAVTWLTGPRPLRILELGAGTGQLTGRLLEQGHDVLATDPAPEMVRRLRQRWDVPALVATAEQIPVPSRSVDAVVCGQSFHWFDHERATREIARVVRPDGHLGVVWNLRDDGIPWVRRLSALIGVRNAEDLVKPLMETPYFGFVESARFRYWQVHTAATLLEMVGTRSAVIGMKERERTVLLQKVRELYDGYGRGHDGMQLPYLTHCYRAVVRHQEEAPKPPPRRYRPGQRSPVATPAETVADDVTRGPSTPADLDDPGTSLIDFR